MADTQTIGGVKVELGVDTGGFYSALNGAKNALGNFAQWANGGGRGLGIASAIGRLGVGVIAAQQVAATANRIGEGIAGLWSGYKGQRAEDFLNDPSVPQGGRERADAIAGQIRKLEAMLGYRAEVAHDPIKGRLNAANTIAAWVKNVVGIGDEDTAIQTMSDDEIKAQIQTLRDREQANANQARAERVRGIEAQNAMGLQTYDIFSLAALQAIRKNTGQGAYFGGER